MTGKKPNRRDFLKSAVRAAVAPSLAVAVAPSLAVVAVPAPADSLADMAPALVAGPPLAPRFRPIEIQVHELTGYSRVSRTLIEDIDVAAFDKMLGSMFRRDVRCE
jgi:hypothetical protein